MANMWKRLVVKLAMTQDRDKTRKAKPFFWCASKTVRINEEDHDLEHGRPLIVFEADDPEDNCVIVVFPNRIVAQTRSQETVIFNPNVGKLPATGEA